MKIGAIFDWDGVIVDSARIHRMAWEALAQEEGKVLPQGYFEQSFGLKNADIIPSILKWTREENKIQRWSARKEELYRYYLRRIHLEPLPGVYTLLEKLKPRGIPCAIGSSTERLNIEIILTKFALENAFDALVTAEDVTHGKPDPEVFLKAAQKIKCKPRHCVVFEDAPAGIQAARAAEMKTIGVATTHPPAILGQADIVVSRLSDLTLNNIYTLFSQEEATRKL